MYSPIKWNLTFTLKCLYSKMMAAKKWYFCNSSPKWCLTKCVPTPFWLGLRPHNPFFFIKGLQIWLTKRAGGFSSLVVGKCSIDERVVVETKHKTIIKLWGCVNHLNASIDSFKYCSWLKHLYTV